MESNSEVNKDKCATIIENNVCDLNLNLKSILQKYLKKENIYEFDYFLVIIKQRQSDKDFMQQLLEQLKINVNILDPNVFESTLVNVLCFDIKWHEHYSNNKIILASLSDFLTDLNSAYTSYNYKCLSMLVKMFTIVNTNVIDEVTAPQINLINCEAIYDFSHNIINHLVKVAPSCKTHIAKLFDIYFPYMSKETTIQEAYVRNLLKVAQNIKEIRLILLEICVQKILKIDVNCQRYQIINEMKTNQCSQVEENSIPIKTSLADKLDSIMFCLFEFIKLNCFENSLFNYSVEENNCTTAKFNWDSCKSIYKDLLFTFDKYILSTYGSSHVQFIMFYICSFRSMLSEGLLDYLWKKFSSVNSCSVIRTICCYYLGSFLARAKYISTSTCVATLQLMIKWIHNYIETLNTNSNNYLNFDLHRIFYALCQTIFYVIIFRSRQLFQVYSAIILFINDNT